MTKLSAELMVAEYGDAYGIRFVIDRCGLLTGPWQMAKADQGVVAVAGDVAQPASDKASTETEISETARRILLLHIRIIGSTAAFWRDPGDIL